MGTAGPIQSRRELLSLISVGWASLYTGPQAGLANQGKKIKRMSQVGSRPHVQNKPQDPCSEIIKNFKIVTARP